MASGQQMEADPILSNPAFLRKGVALLVSQADALPKGDPERRRLLELAQAADQFAEMMEVRQQVDEEEAAMQEEVSSTGDESDLESKIEALKQQALESIPPELLEHGVDLAQESLPFLDSPADSTKDH
jgi:Ran GTPase-activating protein (RanGAP) involved in mRNA processing and transport